MSHSLRDRAQETLKASQRSVMIVQQLLVSRRQTLQPVTLELNHQLKETIKLLRTLIGEEILITTRLINEPLFVRAEPAQMEQGFLLTNARDAMPGGVTS
jgi:two-component system cell cycle sensor histidine kinase/response regulator CckA